MKRCRRRMNSQAARRPLVAFFAHLVVLSPDLRGAVEITSGEPVKVGIYFDDHGEQDANDMRTLPAGVKLTSRSLERRARHSHLQPVDAHDLPICAGYLDAVHSLGCRIRHSFQFPSTMSDKDGRPGTPNEDSFHRGATEDSMSHGGKSVSISQQDSDEGCRKLGGCSGSRHRSASRCVPRLGGSS